jgi:hypothetical protein
VERTPTRGQVNSTLGCCELQQAPEFLFERRSLVHHCADRRPGDEPGDRFVLVAGDQLPYRLTRREELLLSRSEAPILTITSDPHNSIAVLGGSGPDWMVTFCAQGDGKSEAEARERLQQIALHATGGTVSLTSPGLYKRHQGSGDLVVEGPTDAGVVIHGSYTLVEVRDLAGPVRIAATHARARILETTGQLDATAGAVDFAGASGRVTLSAEAEINLKMTSKRFEGTLLAWAQRSVRMRVPPGFSTPIEVMVSRRRAFVCRAEFSSEVKQQRQGDLYVFSYGVHSGGPREGIHLRSEEATVVIDTLD